MPEKGPFPRRAGGTGRHGPAGDTTGVSGADAGSSDIRERTPVVDLTYGAARWQNAVDRLHQDGPSNGSGEILDRLFGHRELMLSIDEDPDYPFSGFVRKPRHEPTWNAILRDGFARTLAETPESKEHVLAILDDQELLLELHSELLASGHFPEAIERGRLEDRWVPPFRVFDLQKGYRCDVHPFDAQVEGRPWIDVRRVEGGLHVAGEGFGDWGPRQGEVLCARIQDDSGFFSMSAKAHEKHPGISVADWRRLQREEPPRASFTFDEGKLKATLGVDALAPDEMLLVGVLPEQNGRRKAGEINQAAR